MIQLKLTDEQFQDLFYALFEAERSCERSSREARCFSGADFLIEENTKEAHRYKELRSFIIDTKEVI